jgi:broad specificity phosphatase PhoE
MIYIIRHGQTIWNLKKMKQGRHDSPLTLKGIEQAHKISKILESEIQDIQNYRMIISPQWRCQQYASLICELLDLDFMNCVVDDRLREHSFGLWEGKNEDQIELEFPGFLEKRYQPENRWSYIVPMGESYELLSQRVSNMLERHDEEKIIYVCHEMVSKVIRGNLLNMNPQEILELNHPQDRIFKICKNSKVSLELM